jgi:hypothetical protein
MSAHKRKNNKQNLWGKMAAELQRNSKDIKKNKQKKKIMTIGPPLLKAFGR